MEANIQMRYDARAKVIKALAHASRLFIVDELAKGPRCVCELTEMVGADISTVSKHLSILKNAGVVSDSKKGTQVYYSLKCPCIMNFFSCVETVLQTAAQEQKQIVG